MLTPKQILETARVTAGHCQRRRPPTPGTHREYQGVSPMLRRCDVSPLGSAMAIYRAARPFAPGGIPPATETGDNSPSSPMRNPVTV